MNTGKKARAVASACVALFAFAAFTPNAVAQARMTIATAGTGGMFYVYGGAVAKIVSQYVPNTSMTVEATGGSVENMKMLSKGQADLATTSADVLHEAYTDYAKSKRFGEKVDVRALFTMYPQPHHLVTLANSNVKAVTDVRGKRTVVGAPGSGTEVKTQMLLQALGITYRDIKPEFLSFAEAAEALQDRTVDAAFLGVNYPAPAIVSLAMTNPIRLVPFSDADIAKINKSYPFLTKSTIPANTYKGVTSDTQTVSVQTMIVSRADLPDEAAYQIVKAVFDHMDELKQINPSFAQTTLAGAMTDAVPMHPGALRYYKEKGLIN